MNYRISLFFVFFVFCVNNCDGKKYDNYTLFRGVAVNESHLDFFRRLSEKYDVNFWRSPGKLYMPIEFLITPEHNKKFQEEADRKGIYLTPLMKDVQSAFDKQTVMTYIRRNLKSFNWQSYFRLNDIYNWLKDLQKTYPDEMTIINIGTTAESRKILAVRIVLKGCKMRSKVIVEGGIHAREWISTAFVTYMIQEILQAPTSNNTHLKRIALTYEWLFMPLVNPDGYEYSHTQDRLWRKNRGNPAVDLNRNFDFAYAKVGVSHEKYSDIYCGPGPFSEKETIAMSKFITENSKNLEYYVSFHSYGQYMIIPYAHLTKHLQNFEEVKQMGLNAAKVIYERYRTKYFVGTAYDTVGYRTSGVSSCWVKSNFDVPYVLTLELRDDGEFGFALPPSQILPTCKETMDGLITFLTPRSKKYAKIHHKHLPDTQKRAHMDLLVIVLNILFCIIVGFD